MNAATRKDSTRMVRTAMRAAGGTATAALAIALGASGASAQLANASTAALGVGTNVTATARELSAISANPAGLAMPGSGFAIGLPSLQFRAGMGPVSTTNLAEVEGLLITPTVKEEWLTRIAESGGQNGSVGADVNEFALALGNLGFQVSSTVGVNLNLSPDIVETLLYGNAGRTGDPADLDLGGSHVRTSALTTAALGFGFGLPAVDADMAIGATVKYTMGHFVAVAEEQGGVITSDPIAIQMEFPFLQTDEEIFEDGEYEMGTGIGLDLGAQWKRGRLALGVHAQNVINTFEWDLTQLVYRPGTVDFELGTSESDFDPQPADGAPESMLAEIQDLKFQPVLAVGAAYDLAEQFTVSGDFRKRFGEGLNPGPEFHAGVGADFRWLPLVDLRAGLAVITDGIQYSGGVTVSLLGIHVSADGAMQRVSSRDVGIFQVGVSLFGR